MLGCTHVTILIIIFPNSRNVFNNLKDHFQNVCKARVRKRKLDSDLKLPPKLTKITLKVTGQVMPGIIWPENRIRRYIIVTNIELF